PDELDAEVGAFVHGVLGGLGSCSDDDRVDTARDRAQAPIAAISLDVTGVRVDREDVVAALAQTLVHEIASVPFGRAGNTGDRYPFVGQERGRRILDGLHDPSSTWSRAQAPEAR